jgi:membrane protease YdiL (CAAX protease family)
MTRSEPVPRFHTIITWVFISGMIFLRIILYGIVVALHHGSEVWINPVCSIGTYLLTALLVWWERAHLAEFFIDKLALAILILGKPFELFLRWFIMRYPDSHPNYYLLYLPISIGLLLIVLFSRSSLPPIRRKNWAWLLVAVLTGIAVGVLWGYLLRFQFSRNLGKIIPNLLFILPAQQLVMAGVMEEPFFRGFLWGGLRRSGWKDGWILFFQTGLFLLGHMYYFGNMPISFWVVVPTGGLVLGFLTWKSRSIATSMTAHGFSNAFAQLVAFYRF